MLWHGELKILHAAFSIMGILHAVFAFNNVGDSYVAANQSILSTTWAACAFVGTVFSFRHPLPFLHAVLCFAENPECRIAILHAGLGGSRPV